MNVKRKNLVQKIVSAGLALSLCLGLLPATALAAPRAASVQDAHDCAAAASVASLLELQNVLGSGGEDILLSPAEDDAVWSVTSALSVPAGRTVHIRVAEGKRVTLKRGGSATGINLFQVAAGGTLILGDGQVSYNGASLTEAAQKGDYTVIDKFSGSLILDGGAVWTKGSAYTPGDSVGDNIVMYDDDGGQYRYTNSGVTATAALIQSSGTLDIWNGVKLQNNVLRNGANSYGSAIQSLSGSTLDLFGGEISHCVTAALGDDNNNDTGRGAVFIGSFVTSNWNAKPAITNSHFNMYGGVITNNAIVGNNQDGGGVSVETAYMDLYGGEISYNHGGLSATGGVTGDGGGLMVRNNAQFTMWGGSVDHNFAGGYGGGIVAWNATVNIKGGSITQNKASYGGGVAIASSNDGNENVTAQVAMDGGVISHNEAINSIANDAGIGGGICVGAGSRVMGCSLELTGGVIRQNTAVNGGGMAVYAGGGYDEGSLRNTSATLSGNFQLTTNSADQHGNGMYIENTNSANRHYLVKLAGGARVDTNNPVYFANVGKNQTPIQVTDTLTTEGTAAIFEFSEDFWKGSNASYAKAEANKKVVTFAKDVQENKIALESSQWYLGASSGDLVLKNASDTPQYTIRNGTPVTVSGKVYYRVYADLTDAVSEAVNGDVLYIFYNTTIDTPAVVSDNKHLTLMAESTSSASRDAALSGSGPSKTCWLEDSSYGYTIMRGSFLQYVGTGGTHNASGGTSGVRSYRLTTTSSTLTAANTLSFNIRNDYTITLSSRLYLGESAKGTGAGQAAITVAGGAALEVGQVAAAGMGAGALTFDGNFSSPKEGSMFQVNGALTFHSGITVKNHTNYSMAHPGTVEVRGGGVFTMKDGSAISGGVSPVAGAVYVAENGSFTMDGGSVSGNTGAMPRYGFFTDSSRLRGYDSAYWGQPKYYMGAGAIYNLGGFTMNGGAITGNRGEYGALANLGGTARLVGGSISENTALTGIGEGKNSLSVAGYTEGAKPAIPDATAYSPNAASGGGVYVGGGTAEMARGFSVTQNTAQTGGGVAVGCGRDISRSISGYDSVTGGLEYLPDGTATAKEPRYATPSSAETQGRVTLQGGSLTDNTASGVGGGLAVDGAGAEADVDAGVILQRNTARSGGGIAAAQGGRAVFRNELTENTAQSGGGVYVGAGSAVTAQGSLTANQADYNGGGAYVEGGDTPGKLILDGALVNNNRLNEPRGFGVGIYNWGELELTAAGGVQPLSATTTASIWRRAGW